VFRRRRQQDAQAGPDDQETWDEPAGEEDEEGEEAAGGTPAEPGWGPWDATEDVPEAERLDFGSLQVPVTEGSEIQLNIAEDQGPLIVVVRGDSSLQLQAFAAPKSGGLWDDVRQEIATAVSQAGGRSQEADGPFGTELRAQVPGEPGGLQPIRFIGVDGPRWFLRGVISGPAASHPELARPFEELFADIVVVRGDHPLPPRELLEIRLPEEAQRALQDQLEQEAGGDPSYQNPFERGPEITETR
jgi:hypothetical protein